MTIALTLSAASYGTYDDLTAAIPEYLDGMIDSTQLPGWIGLVESEINRRLALNPVRPQLSREAITLDDEYVSLPSDFLKEVSLDYLDSSTRKTIRFVDHAGLVDDVANPVPEDWLFSTTPDYTGAPEVAAILEGEMRLYPVPDDTYSGNLLYYAKLPGISSSVQSNWFLTAHADVYLYGLLFHANAFLPDREKAAEWFELFNTRLDQVLSSYPKTPIRRQLRGDAMLNARRWL